MTVVTCIYDAVNTTCSPYQFAMLKIPSCSYELIKYEPEFIKQISTCHGRPPSWAATCLVVVRPRYQCPDRHISTLNYLWSAATCNERTLLPGPEGVRSWQVLLYSISDINTHRRHTSCICSRYRMVASSCKATLFQTWGRVGTRHISLIQLQTRFAAGIAAVDSRKLSWLQQTSLLSHSIPVTQSRRRTKMMNLRMRFVFRGRL